MIGSVRQRLEVNITLLSAVYFKLRRGDYGDPMILRLYMNRPSKEGDLSKKVDQIYSDTQKIQPKSEYKLPQAKPSVKEWDALKDLIKCILDI